MKKKIRISSNLIYELIKLCEGKISSANFEKLISALNGEAAKYFFTSTSEANLLRILNSVYDKSVFLSDLIKYPHHVEILFAIAASSNYLTDIVVRNPEYLYQLFDPSYLSSELSEDKLALEITEGADKFKSLNSKCNFLRQLKKRYILKIGLNDILGLNDLISITNELSILAKKINEKLFDLCFDEINNKYGTNCDKNNFCLCSLGKLGGNELNYSSDVDLILFYNNNFVIEEIKKEFHDFLSEVVLLFIKCSTDITEKGYIYRVDFRLRPDGRYSPLCKSFDDYIRYYETRGEDWERQMLIKLNFVAGSKLLYNKFFDYLQPFIFPTSFSIPLFDQIRKMKLNIERHNKDIENIKLFIGGIRDIEFSIQALQLLYGGQYPKIRSGNTLYAIDVLSKINLLKESEKNIFSEAYILYRKIEHFLQLMNDTQTHVIPTKGELREKLVIYLGFTSEKMFKQKLNMLRSSVRQIYDEILISEKANTYENKINFSDHKRADSNLKFLRFGSGISEQKKIDTRTAKLFQQIEPHFLKYLSQTDYPDIVLENFTRVIQSVKFPSILYNEFIDSNFLHKFLSICENNAKGIDFCITDKDSTELLLSRKVFEKLSMSELISYSTSQVLFILSIQFTLKIIKSEKLSLILTEYLKAKICSIAVNSKLNYSYCIIGLGSFGNSTMTFSSDIDLVIIIDSIENKPYVQKDFQVLLNSFQKELNPFSVEFRLRPEGKSSQLIWDVEHYKKYITERARVWEFQAFTKLNFIYGNINLFDVFFESILVQLKKYEAEYIKKEVIMMHRSIQKELISVSEVSFNLKKQRGGLSSIEFLIQMILLSNHKLFNTLSGKSTIKIIIHLKKSINKNDFDILLHNYKFLRRIIFAQQNLFNSRNYLVPTSLDKRKTLAKYLKLPSVESFNKELNHLIQSTNKLFEKYVG